MTMPPNVIDLVEYQTTTEPIAATQDELAILLKIPDLTVSPSGRPGYFDLTPGSTVGTVLLGSRVIHIRPKIPIDRLFFLLSYSIDPKHWSQQQTADLRGDASVLEAIIFGFVGQVRRAIARGPLRGYLPMETSLIGLRGRLRMDDQVRSHFGMAPPLECQYDEFTVDILENRLIRAALTALKRMHLRSEKARSSLYAFDQILEDVTPVQYDSRNVPSVIFTRLNRHYLTAIQLSRLILRAMSPELQFGLNRFSTFLIDMNQVFENFVVVGLREALRLSEAAFPRGCQGRSLFLDEANRISLKPDVSWWKDSRCIFVGDVKYKRTEIARIKHADLYQLLAYTVSARLRNGLLIYAAGEGEDVEHCVIHVGKTLHAVTMDLCSSPATILRRVDLIAEKIRAECFPYAIVH